MSTNRLINDSILTDIAGAIREKNKLTNLYHPQDMAAAIRGLKLAGGMGIVIGDHIVDGKWKRPVEWPDLDSLQREDDTLYMTVDNSGRIDDTPVSFAVTTQSGQYSVEVGDVVNGQFVSTSTTMFNSGTTCKLNSVSFNTNYPVLRIKAAGKFADFAFNAYGALNGHTYSDVRQSAIVEAVGHVSKYNGGTWGTWYLEHDARVIKSITNGSNMSSTWQHCYSLQSLDLSGWDTSNWAVTTMQSTWYNCYSLQLLDLNGWDTSNWSVTTLSSTWYQCYSLQSLDLSGWDTRNWSVTNIQYTWQHCYSLQSLDINGWDTSNWSVTNIQYTWYQCYSLQSLDLSGWDTRNWSVTTLSSTWYQCYSLQSLDLSGWDTRNWSVTTLSSTWCQCYSLQSLDLSGWDTTRFAFGTSNNQNTLRHCRALRTLKLGTLTNHIKNVFSSADISMFALNHFLRDVDWGAENTFSLTTALYLVNSNRLTRQSILGLATALATTSTARTVQLGTTNLNKLSADDKKLFTDKGYTLA